MGLIAYLLLLLLTFYLLSQVTDKYFIDSLDRIAERLNLSSDMAGATLMAIGSSAPELFVALVAVLQPGGHEEIGMGTIVGSALFNILVIIGAVAMVKKATITWQPIVRDILFYLLAIGLLFWAFHDGGISLTESIIFVVCFAVYVFAVVRWRRWFPYHDPAADLPQAEEGEERVKYTSLEKVLMPLDYLLYKVFPPPNHYFGVFFMSIGFIAVLSWVLVQSAIGISEILNVPEVIIGITVLAVGTSVPDMISSIIVARQGRGDMGITNAIGSNIFDVLIGLGLPWMIALLVSHREMIPVSRENLFFSVVLLFISVLVIFFMLIIRRWRIGRPTGIILIGLYLIYLIYTAYTLFA